MRNLVAIYARLSREDEGKIDGSKESRSIENQIKGLTSFANENNFEIYEIYYDDGFTGGDFNRPAFQRMLNDIKQRKFNILLVKDFSRIGRSLYRVGKFVEETLPQNNIRLISINDKYDSSKNFSEESIVLKAFLNDYYLKEFRKKMKFTRLRCAKTQHLNYYPKYGYNFDENRKEIIDDYSAGVVRQIFDLIGNKGLSTVKVADILNEQGVLTRSRYATEVLGLKALNKVPSKEWNADKVWAIAKDYEYCGHSLNWVRHIKEEQVLLKNTHLAIIDEDLYARTQEVIKNNSTRKEKLDHLGKLFVDRTTGKNLLYEKSKSNKNGKYYLRINNLRQYSFLAEDIENILYRDVLNVIECCKFDQIKFYDIMKNRLMSGNDFDKSKINSRLKSLNNEYSALLERYFNQLITEEMYENKSKVLLLKIKELELQLERLSETQAKIALFDVKFKKFIEDLKNTPKEKFDLIRFAISKVYINNVSKNNIDMTILYKFEEI